MLKIGRYELRSVVTSRFRLDGGAMFGVVPKVLWSKVAPPDELNRIQLAMRTLVAIDQVERRVILVDTGAGPKWPPDEAERFGIEVFSEALPAALAGFGLTEADVTDVLVTHLHFDHNGGLSEWVDRPGGPTRLRFPQARHWLHRGHWEYKDRPTEKDRASFLERDIAALRTARVLTSGSERGGLLLVDGDPPKPALPDVEWFVSRGHTRYQLLPLFRGENTALLFTGDVVPTAGHLRVPWVMAYDLEPLVTMEEKRRIHAWCREQNLLLAFPHDPAVAGCRIAFEGERVTVADPLPL